ncbi:energy transducer TonB [Novilysobacter selenitireducens]|uniref:energy transducer TonB n=1 Tax=Novilysobacter selenitireducens TaxID=2872639 RepID=UPI001CC16743|nr:energy transducer TonB [Lysobacter selenitireducens]
MRVARTWIGLFLALVTLPAFAGGPGAVRKQVESSMLVKGTIDVNADGSVAGHALEQPDKLPPGVVDLVTQAVRAWRFGPVKLREGEAYARAGVSVRVVAKKVDEDGFIVEVRGAQFSEARPGESVTADKMSPPPYPRGLGASGIGGEVYLIVKVGRSGEVEDVVAEQVNLFTLGSESQIARWRDQLAKSAVRAARQWTFSPPTKGAYVDRPFWLARVPVAYHVTGRHRQAQYGQWQAYVPGPHLGNPWYRDESAPDADAIAAGNVQPVDNAFRLLTPMQGG